MSDDTKKKLISLLSPAPCNTATILSTDASRCKTGRDEMQSLILVSSFMKFAKIAGLGDHGTFPSCIYPILRWLVWRFDVSRASHHCFSTDYEPQEICP
jgi:hypothetical protein